MLWRVVEVVVVGRCFALNHCLEFVDLLHQLLIEFFQLITLTNAILQLQRQREDVILLLSHHAVDLIARNLLPSFAFNLQPLVRALQMLVNHELLMNGTLQVLVLL